MVKLFALQTEVFIAMKKTLKYNDKKYHSAVSSSISVLYC